MEIILPKTVAKPSIRRDRRLAHKNDCWMKLSDFLQVWSEQGQTERNLEDGENRGRLCNPQRKNTIAIGTSGTAIGQ